MRVGDLYESGGTHLRDQYLWMPMHHGSWSEGGLIVAIDPADLSVASQFQPCEAISAIAEGVDGHLYGFSLDSSTVYEWTQQGSELRRVPNASGAIYGDMTVVRGSLVCAGLYGTSGVIDIFDPASLTLLARHSSTAHTPDLAPVTGKGCDYIDDSLVLLPDDGEFPALLSYVLDGMSLEEFIPSTGP